MTLLGTVADWTDVHTRFLVLADTWMHSTPETSGWVKDVDAFLKQFIAARSGKADEALPDVHFSSTSDDDGDGCRDRTHNADDEAEEDSLFEQWREKKS